MKKTICEQCKTRKAEHKHHMYSNTKINRKLYGSLIDDEKNIQSLCSICHLYKPIKKLDEIQFCELLNIVPKSKEGKEIYARLKRAA